MLRRLLLLILLLCAASVSAAAINVVATTSSMGMLVRELGDAAVRVTVLAPPDRDAHYLQARPSMIHALRRADLVVAVGADLELGWLPAALQSAANPHILPGRSGYFEAAAQVPLLDAGQPADRAKGDVHPLGNPHVNMDPLRMATIARALAQRLAALDPAATGQYQQRAAAFAATVAERLPQWQAMATRASEVVFYHKDGDYLMHRLGLPIAGYIESMPGVPPTANHIRELINRLQGRQGVILYTVYQPSQGPEALASALDWNTVKLPLEPPITATAKDYLAFIDRWVQAVAMGQD